MGVVMDEIAQTQFGGMKNAVRQIGDSWSLRIVWVALQGAICFDDLQSSLGIARNTLSNRLSDLVNDDILCKHPVQSDARRREYRLTGKGEALRPALELLESWGTENH
jgi:DNA-binding HxlR family transcriptional regulator